MTTNLQIASGADFDSLFQAGGGNQLFGIYGIDGQDVGQRYYNVSEGSAYGNTAFLASDGGDIGYKLCKAGSYHVFNLTVGFIVSRQYGYYEGQGGALSPNVLNGYRIAGITSKADRVSLFLANNAMPWDHARITIINDGRVYTLRTAINYYYSETTDNPFVQYLNQTIQLRLEAW